MTMSVYTCRNRYKITGAISSVTLYRSTVNYKIVSVPKERNKNNYDILNTKDLTFKETSSLQIVPTTV